MLGGVGWAFTPSRHTNSLLFSVKVKMINDGGSSNMVRSDLKQVGNSMGAVIAIWVVASK